MHTACWTCYLKQLVQRRGLKPNYFSVYLTSSPGTTRFPPHRWPWWKSGSSPGSCRKARERRPGWYSRLSGWWRPSPGPGTGNRQQLHMRHTGLLQTCKYKLSPSFLWIKISAPELGLYLHEYVWCVWYICIDDKYKAFLSSVACKVYIALDTPTYKVPLIWLLNEYFPIISQMLCYLHPLC